jgi:hypothetical protein
VKLFRYTRGSGERAWHRARRCSCCGSYFHHRDTKPLPPHIWFCEDCIPDLCGIWFNWTKLVDAIQQIDSWRDRFEKAPPSLTIPRWQLEELTKTMEGLHPLMVDPYG